MTAADRVRRTAEADALCRAAYDAAGLPGTGVALVAVGGFGRAELAPYSDLDVVLVHDPATGLGEAADRLWYPLWDSTWRLDHSVRSLPEMVDAAERDVRVASGLLHVRHLAGDAAVSLQLRTTMLAEWRRLARTRLPELRDLMVRRHQLMGELAHAAVPDLKEAEGGLRDATILRSLTATWLVDVPPDLERSRSALLDVRDALQMVADRASDRIHPEHWRPLAEGLGLPDALAAQTHVREIGRRLTHLSRLTWRRVGDALVRPRPGPRRPRLLPIARGVALASGEVVLDGTARPADDPVLLLRAAVAAAEHDVVLAPPTAARLARECAPLPEPWPAEARRLLVRLLASGPGLLGVWETLDETGALRSFLPEWEQIRLLPQASGIHRFTVDRHCVETCVEAAALMRSVARPDVLVLAALLHDIGKSSLVEHSVAGAPMAREFLLRTGFDAEVVDLVGLLVRWHLLLARTATTRDPDDPATIELVTAAVGTVEALDLLAALTEADARATSPQAWSAWRARLVLDLARRARTALGTSPAPVPQPPPVVVPEEVAEGGIAITLEPIEDGARVTVLAPDRVGLLADLAAMFALRRVRVRSARIWAQGHVGVSVWEVEDGHLDAAVLRHQYAAVRDGRVDPARRLGGGDRPGPGPSVAVRPEASAQATVLEVRTADRLGVVHLVCAALARLDIAVRSAHVDTLGPQAVDVFYLQEGSAGVLSDQRAADAARAVRAALSEERLA